MTAIERSALYAVIGVLIFGCYTLLERHEGAVKCVNADKAAVAKQEAHNADVAKSEAQTINQEAIDHAKAIAAVPDPVPVLTCVRYYTAPTVPKASPAQPRIHAAPDVPKAVGPSFDPAPAIGRIGQTADAQIAELQDYITKVCLR